MRVCDIVSIINIRLSINHYIYTLRLLFKILSYLCTCCIHIFSVLHSLSYCAGIVPDTLAAHCAQGCAGKIGRSPSIAATNSSTHLLIPFLPYSAYCTCPWHYAKTQPHNEVSAFITYLITNFTMLGWVGYF